MNICSYRTYLHLSYYITNSNASVESFIKILERSTKFHIIEKQPNMYPRRRTKNSLQDFHDKRIENSSPDHQIPSERRTKLVESS